MENTNNTASLRNMAPHWSLAGDKQLLNILQDIHQKIMTRCHETNTKLEEMANALDGANIDLQNVNNKFMALSNSQFIESRVYEDDIVVTNEETRNKPLPTKVDAGSELANLKQSLKTLESMHECVRILNSESDSDTDDDDGRVVFRPKDLYSQRPLPHIIGSHAWKRKWHAGLIPENSDSDSSTSKVDEAVPEQYSESESENSDIQADRLNLPQRTVSSSSSMVESEPSAPAPLSQAHIAAELARKLGGNLPEIPVKSPEPEVPKPQAVAARVYKPQKPPTSTIFFDEPPPLDNSYPSDKEDSSDEDDIFAELHQNKPTQSTNKDRSRLNEDLFGDLHNSDTVDDLFGAEKEHKSNLDDETVERAKDKKPVGGISVFGSLKGTESIGASILKRNPRKTYSSDEESDDEMLKNRKTLQTKHPESVTSKTNANLTKPVVSSKNETQKAVINPDETEAIEKKSPEKSERDILQDLFSKNKPSHIKNKDSVTKQDPKPKDKVDLFSDNIFDDIDDIFTENIVKVPIKEADKNIKSIFDDDDDDLFANITVASEKTSASKNTRYEAKDLFDSDDVDNLFSDVPVKSSNTEQQPSISKLYTNTSDNKATLGNKNSKSIFDDDSDEDIFSNVQVKDVNSLNFNDKETIKQTNSLDNSKQRTITPYENREENKTTNGSETEHENHIKMTHNDLATNQNQNVLTPNSKHQTTEHSPALFDDEEINDLFQNSHKKEIKDSKEDSSHRNMNNKNTESKENMNDKFEPTDTDINKDLYEVNVNSSAEETPGPSGVKDDDPPSNKNDVESHDNDSQSFLKLENDNDIFSTKMENAPLPSPPQPQLSLETNDFNDIFSDVPPEFEKPKEPKKSKNINALFDDDSDDEALFFKKDDIMSDEKPDASCTIKEDNLFRIFSDEPPAIDIDFPPEPTKDVITEPEFHKQVEFEDPHKLSTQSTMKFNDTVKSDSNKEIEDNEEVYDNIVESSKKSIGKLKQMNFNINVNTLLPGASPKKSKPIEEPDGLVVSVPDSDKQTNIEDTGSTLVKSVSFEDDADSELLNNKLSKERAKIQVKRRPSTRRARREAVKKSGIDFGSNDSTDNSSSIESPKSTTYGIVEDTPKKTVERLSTQKDVKSKVVYILNDEDIFTNVKTNKKVDENVKTQTNDVGSLDRPIKDISMPPDDEDIFKNIQSSKVENESSKSLNKATDLVDQQRKENDASKKTETVKPTKSKASIFDDMSDEESELFCNKKPFTTNTKNIFGSDSEEELFGNSKKENKFKTVEKPKATNFKVEVKKSLFDDDDSGDDLFGGGHRGKSLSIKPKEVKPTQTQTVINDPLSVFSDDK